jgi:hypothetical protein
VQATAIEAHLTEGSADHRLVWACDDLGVEGVALPHPHPELALDGAPVPSNQPPFLMIVPYVTRSWNSAGLRASTKSLNRFEYCLFSALSWGYSYAQPPGRRLSRSAKPYSCARS